MSGERSSLPPGVDWIPVPEALARLRAAVEPVAEPEPLPAVAAAGRILAREVRASRANPAAANSAVDGYGFAAASLSGDGPQRLPLAPGRAAAGVPFDQALPAGAAVPILTGAILPAGVDTVALQEEAVVRDGILHLARPPRPGANTRARAEDVDAGDLIAPAGRILTPPDLALLAACGTETVAVRRPLRVAVLSTGDELAEAGGPAAPHQVYDANRPMLMACLRRWGMEPMDLGQVGDDAAAVAAALAKGAATADAIVASGGASSGAEDHVARLLGEEGARIAWRIAVKPGRPLAFGHWRERLMFALPGNPVAAFVCLLMFARPALLRLAGAGWLEPVPLALPAGFEKRKRPGRTEYLRARLRDGRVEVFSSEGSGRISGLAWAEGLVALDAPARTIAPGDPVAYLPFSAFGL
ncbi:MAG: molybdopterin-binding protein [Pseudomonadota bacterium]